MTFLTLTHMLDFFEGRMKGTVILTSDILEAHIVVIPKPDTPVNRLLELFHIAEKSGTRIVFLSLYVEKAFARIGWPNLIQTLEYCNIEGPFLKTIEKSLLPAFSNSG
ncbi:hypothetical protein GDO86_005859 [Hymenochirus boettgeri]|uniref:Uncharacterized protein n=1 Tax=Hymenochirus boettgeri TaxID=247094 RepID=A0A8T2J8E2_9PIPI|nr:hypothetical protein GDO86_005859 [Hymenochirus boettgeri]